MDDASATRDAEKLGPVALSFSPPKAVAEAKPPPVSSDDTSPVLRLERFSQVAHPTIVQLSPSRLRFAHCAVSVQRPTLDFGTIKVGQTRTLLLSIDNPTVLTQVRYHARSIVRASRALSPTHCITCAGGQAVQDTLQARLCYSDGSEYSNSYLRVVLISKQQSSHPHRMGAS